MENWEAVWRRMQPLCAEYARRYPQSKVLYVGLPRNVSHSLLRGRLRDVSGAMVGAVPDIPNLTVMRPLKLAPNTLASGLRFNEKIARMQIQLAIRRLGITDPILYINPHDAAHMLGRMGESASIYDIGDDWLSMKQSQRMVQRTTAQDALLCRRADAVVVVSQQLYDLKLDLARNLHLIPNGVDVARYDVLHTSVSPVPDIAAQWPKPVLGYLGTLHLGRIDVDLLESVARRVTQGSIVLLGPDMLPASERARLEATGRVIFAGIVEHTQVANHLRAFDVCITPHKITAFTESNNPLKLWEYLATGKPVVSTPVAGFRDFPQYVRLAKSAEEFLLAIQDALEEPFQHVETRRAAVRCHSWAARLDAIEAVINDCLSRKNNLSALENG